MELGDMIRYSFTKERGYVVKKRKYSYDMCLASGKVKKIIIGDIRYFKIRF